MQRVSLSLFLVAITFVSCSLDTVAPVVVPSTPTISADELKTLVDTGAVFVFLDVRKPEELEKYGTLGNYVNIPVGQLEARISEVPRDVPVVTACGHGDRAERAVATLEKHDYRDVKWARLDDYREKGYLLIYPKASQ